MSDTPQCDELYERLDRADADEWRQAMDWQKLAFKLERLLGEEKEKHQSEIRRSEADAGLSHGVQPNATLVLNAKRYLVMRDRPDETWQRDPHGLSLYRGARLDAAIDAAIGKAD